MGRKPPRPRSLIVSLIVIALSATASGCEGTGTPQSPRTTAEPPDLPRNELANLPSAKECTPEGQRLLDRLKSGRAGHEEAIGGELSPKERAAIACDVARQQRFYARRGYTAEARARARRILAGDESLRPLLERTRYRVVSMGPWTEGEELEVIGVVMKVAFDVPVSTEVTLTSRCPRRDGSGYERFETPWKIENATGLDRVLVDLRSSEVVAVDPNAGTPQASRVELARRAAVCEPPEGD